MYKENAASFSSDGGICKIVMRRLLIPVQVNTAEHTFYKHYMRKILSLNVVKGSDLYFV